MAAYKSDKSNPLTCGFKFNFLSPIFNLAGTPICKAGDESQFPASRDRR